MKKRIIGYDLARALAVFGMVVVNFKIVMGAEQNGPAWLVNVIGLLNGRAAATFVVLAGAGISLLSRRGYIEGNQEILNNNRYALLKRALFLFIVGLLYTPLWPADILHFYGVYIAVAAFMLATPTRYLWAFIVALIMGFALLLVTMNYEQGWDWQTLTYDGLWTPRGMIRHLFFNGFHPVVPWLAFLLVGMILGRQDMRIPKVRRRVFGWGLGVALAAETTSWLLINMLSMGASAGELEEIAAVFGTAPMPPLPLYMLAGAGVACAVIAAMIALGERYADSAWVHPFVATGQIALTLYVAHVVIGMGILDVIGRLENQSLFFSLGASAIFCTAGVLFAHLWRLGFKRGPLESIMRALAG